MPIITVKQVYEQIKAEWDIERILEPYREGGTCDQPIQRSSGTILDWLINKKRFPPEIAGAALISVLVEIKNGREFPGTGEYGSKGHEMVTAISAQASAILQEKLVGPAAQMLAQFSVMDNLIFDKVRAQLPALLIPFAPGTWKWLRRRRGRKGGEANESAQRD